MAAIPKDNAFAQEYEDIELFGKPALFTDCRIDHDSVPDGFFVYDLRSGDDGDPVTVEPFVHLNHAGTVITAEALDFGDGDHLSLGMPGDVDYALNFMGTADGLDEFQYQHTPVDAPHQEPEQEPAQSPEMSM